LIDWSFIYNALWVNTPQAQESKNNTKTYSNKKNKIRSKEKDNKDNNNRNNKNINKK